MEARMTLTKGRILAAVAAAALLSTSARAEAPPCFSHEEFFGIIDNMVGSRRLRPKDVNNILPQPVKFEREPDNDFFHMYRAHPSTGAWLSAVDLRVGRKDSARSYLVLDTAACLKMEAKDVFARYGSGYKIRGPDPYDMNEYSGCYEYRAGKDGEAQTRFCFSIARKPLLVRVTVDRVP